MVSICCQRGYLREVVSSKKLLLQRVISDENAANNGEGFELQKFRGPEVLVKQIKVNTVGSLPIRYDPVTTGSPTYVGVKIVFFKIL